MAVATSHQVVAIGSEADAAGFVLAGVRVVSAATPTETRQAWNELPAAVGVVVLTPQAAAGLGDARWSPGAPLSVVLPTSGPPDPLPDPNEEGRGG